jgi:hypothetical protein
MIAPSATTDEAVMSKEDLIMAYLRGDLGRRQFVRRLVAVGVALTAALAYADMNTHPARADAGTTSAGTITLPSQACQNMSPAARHSPEYCGA